ncbi:galactoside O-acetyltransferase [Bacillus canaveralius]|uniref:Chloramphenicol acetyltransferase n=1 Tax=Bacillus canaveralius TaxID=1403243 RepID=A0A2N5GMK6_9BACI|nr:MULTISPECIES: acyltransferase [Bacillus]PLR82609.1 galactoside O-acetyltransferase [Bacillus sp. V33-4]PLR83166.1 galactoside O-acetyltransferase [Bacillus canaveralius]PLR94084.1 galactoside O-acetyltransferase [Bacillus canaveralius]RSK54116.1 acyltransferase [Bacillus canaveralius]
MLGFYSEEELKKIGFKHIGVNVKISDKSSIYFPETISIGNNVRIDDFCILTGGTSGINIGSYIHIAAFSAIFGSGGGVTLKDFSCLSSRVTLYSLSDDYSGHSLTNPTVPKEFLGVEKGHILIEKHVVIGTNSTVLPGVTIGEGSAIGAHSLVKESLDPWGIYAGTPVRKIKNRKKEILRLEKELKQ